MGKCCRKWNSCPKPIRYIINFLIGALLIGLFGFLFGLIIKLLWNWLMPEIFNLQEITYWQGIGLYLLGRILFGKTSSSSNKYENVECKCSHENIAVHEAEIVE